MDIKDLREEINKIDIKMLKLFEKRMQIVSQVCEYKKNNNLQVLDKKIELDKLAQLPGLVSRELLTYAEEFYKALFKISREYQESKMK